METKELFGQYFIDEEANIYSRPRMGSKGGVIKKWIDGSGYWSVRLCVNGKTKVYKLHRLIATAFIPNQKNLPYINHKDGNKLNCSINNLEWCTASENMSHAYKTGLRKKQSNTGEKYIYLDINTNRFRVIIPIGKKKKRLRRFNTLSDAISARDLFLSS